MDDFQDTDMRALLSRAAPVAEEEPPARDAVGPAIAWGERRRHLDRLAVAVGAAAAVLAVTGGIAALGNGVRHGAAIGPGGPASSSTTAGPAQCNLPDGHPGSAAFCALDAQITGFHARFTDGAAGYIAAKLPADLTVGRSGDSYLKLTKGGTTEYLYPAVSSRKILFGGKEQCATSACQLVQVGGGTAALGAYSNANVVDWVPSSSDGPRVTLVLTAEAPGPGKYVFEDPGMLASPPYGEAKKPVTLLTPQQLAEVVGDPAFRQYATQMFNQLTQLTQRYQALMASELPSTPGGYVSGSIPAGLPGTPDPSATVPSIPLGTSSTAVTGQVGPTFLAPTCWLDPQGNCSTSPVGTSSSMSAPNSPASNSSGANPSAGNSSAANPSATNPSMSGLPATPTS